MVGCDDGVVVGSLLIVGDELGELVGLADGSEDASSVGLADGLAEGLSGGMFVGHAVVGDGVLTMSSGAAGDKLGYGLGAGVVISAGEKLGDGVGWPVGGAVVEGAVVGDTVIASHFSWYLFHRQ